MVLADSVVVLAAPVALAAGSRMAAVVSTVVRVDLTAAVADSTVVVAAMAAAIGN